MKKILGAFLSVGWMLVSVAAVPVFAVETGFDVGNTFSWQSYEGRVWVSCGDPAGGNASYFCEDSSLSPVDYARFVTDPVNADRVELTATWPSGRKVTKRDQFDAVTGRSKGHFNLSIDSVFQRRLLGNGLNRVHYKLTQGGVVVREGDFDAVVNDGGPAKICDTGTVFESQASSCRDANLMCSRYFREAARNCRR